MLISASLQTITQYFLTLSIHEVEFRLFEAAIFIIFVHKLWTWLKSNLR